MNDLSDEAFVKGWITAVKTKSGVKAMAEKLGISYTDATMRANFLRRSGVCLPNMPHPNQKQNRDDVLVESLNDLLKAELGEKAMGWRYRRVYGK